MDWLKILALLAAVVSLGWSVIADVAAFWGAKVHVPLAIQLGSLLAMLWVVVWIISDVVRGRLVQ